MVFPSTIPDTGTWPTGKGRGMCRGCKRDLYFHGTGPVSPYCSTCQHTRKRTDVPLHKLANGRTEVIPQERETADGSWRGDAACRLTEDPGFGIFTLINERMPAEVVAANERYCAQCPVKDMCTREADDHEYIGLWGGSYRHYRANPFYYALHAVSDGTTEFRVPLRIRENPSDRTRLPDDPPGDPASGPVDDAAHTTGAVA